MSQHAGIFLLENSCNSILSTLRRKTELLRAVLWNQPIDVFIVFTRNNSHEGGSTSFFRHELTCRFDPSFSSSNYHIYGVLHDLFFGTDLCNLRDCMATQKDPEKYQILRNMCDAVNSSRATATQTGECGDFTISFISVSPPKPIASRLVNIVSIVYIFPAFNYEKKSPLDYDFHFYDQIFLFSPLRFIFDLCGRSRLQGIYMLCKILWSRCKKLDREVATKNSGEPCTQVSRGKSEMVFVPPSLVFKH